MGKYGVRASDVRSQGNETRLQARSLFFSVIILAVIIGFAGIVSTVQVNGLLARTYSKNLVPITQIAVANFNALYHIRNAYRFLIVTDNSELQERADGAKRYGEEFRNRIERFKSAVSGGEEAALLDDLEAKWDNYLAKYVDFERLGLAGRSYEADMYMTETLRPAFDAADSAMGILVEYNKNPAERGHRNGDALTGGITLTLVVLLLVGVCVGLLLAYFITRKILSEVGGEPGEIAAIAERIASGDLEIRTVAGRDSRS